MSDAVASEPSRTMKGGVRAAVFDPFIVAVVTGPLLLLLASNDDFMFDPIGWLDSYNQLGYFWHYPEHVAHLDRDYKSSRLPWILPGYVAHAIFDEATAWFVLHTAVLIGGGTAMYLLLRDLLSDRLAAAVAAAAWSCCTWVHGLGGWNYQIVAAGSYYLLGLWCIVRASQGRGVAQPMLAGAALAAAVHTHTSFAVLAPVVALFCCPALDETPRARALRIVGDALWIAAGALLATAVLSAVNVATGGRWDFFRPQIDHAISLSRRDPWVLQPSVWISSARHLVIPVLALTAGIAWVVAHGSRMRVAGDPTRVAGSLVAQAWLAFGLMAYIQFVRQQTVLQSYFALPLYCHAFPALGAMLAQTERR